MMEYNKNIMIKNREIKFFDQLEVSDRTRQNYLRAFRSIFLKNILYDYFGTQNLFEITDLKKLWEVYTIINLHPKNLNNHRNYSSALNKYILFLNNGEKYGRRRDFNMKKSKK